MRNLESFSNGTRDGNLFGDMALRSAIWNHADEAKWCESGLEPGALVDTALRVAPRKEQPMCGPIIPNSEVPARPFVLPRIYLLNKFIERSPLY